MAAGVSWYIVLFFLEYTGKVHAPLAGASSTRSSHGREVLELPLPFFFFIPSSPLFAASACVVIWTATRCGHSYWCRAASRIPSLWERMGLGTRSVAGRLCRVFIDRDALSVSLGEACACCVCASWTCEESRSMYARVRRVSLGGCGAHVVARGVRVLRMCEHNVRRWTCGEWKLMYAWVQRADIDAGIGDVRAGAASGVSTCVRMGDVRRSTWAYAAGADSTDVVSVPPHLRADALARADADDVKRMGLALTNHTAWLSQTAAWACSESGMGGSRARSAAPRCAADVVLAASPRSYTRRQWRGTRDEHPNTDHASIALQVPLGTPFVLRPFVGSRSVIFGAFGDEEYADEEGDPCARERDWY
ncbi:hypothetical protein B0H16DRAFT_1741192 [Mycena metata]|uniref:Uncharacterized protein n=1 Tax=Mycena metata TaxID=1033252 RepID=A0AAD7HB95_9AGAR|nr:hypothetical protein B0H16DRAFT_1741192 [Mycena metata]